MLTKESVHKLIESYSPEAFADVVKAACAPAMFVAASRVIRPDGDLPDVTVLGVVRDLPGENGLAAPLLVADIPLGNKPLTERSSRIRQFKAARKALEQVCVNPPVPVDGIIVQGVFAFHDAGGAFRISLVTAKAENGQLVWSQVKRQSFYVTPDPERNATFIQRMTMNWSSLAAIRDAFSVEKLTKEFYSQLFKWYDRACEDERVEYPNDLATDKDNREDKNRKHLLRLITRLMFVWFLKQKGLVPEDLFDEQKLKGILRDFKPLGKKQHQYYRAILQNLFFATLNSEIDERGFAETPTPNRKGEKPTTKHHGVKTKYRYADEFAISRREVIDLFHRIPFLNGGLFECLDQEDEDGKVMYYDGFSLEEFHRDRGTLTWAHVPNDLFFDPDYGIIPLLKRYNFTVEENTPGDEDVALDPELLGKVFENLLGAYNPETEEVVRKSVGAFYTPREIVNYMVDESLIAYLEGKSKSEKVKSAEGVVRALVKEGVRPDDAGLCKTLVAALEGAKILDPACGSGAFPMGALLKMTELLRILKKMPEDANLYALKLQLIENCIFGVDIQEIAVQISKLRFFISLVCEQKPDWDAPNYGINTLPNLETKFVAANSLIGLKRTDAKDGDTSLQQSDLFFDSGDIEKIKKELWEVRHRHFLAKTRREKNALRKEDKELRTKLAKRGKELGYSDDATRLMASWDPYNQNVHADFFDPAWMFNVKDGFDVVIGNPPYISALRMTRTSAEKEEYKKQYPQASGAYDYYILFLLRGSQLSRSEYAWIIPNKFLVAEYANKTLNYLIRERGLSVSVDVSNFDIFESASVYPIVIMGSVRHAGADFKKYKLDRYEDLSTGQLKEVKVKQYGKTFAETGIEVCCGAAGFEASVIKKYVRNGQCANSIPFTVSGNIDRYEYTNQNVRYMKDLYSPAYVTLGKDISMSRKLMWQNPKIIVAGMTKGIEAAYASQPLGIGVGSYAISGFGNYDPYFLLGVLNSRFITYYCLTTFTDKHLAGGYLAINKSTIEQIPLPKDMNQNRQKKIVSLVDKILVAKKKDPDADTSEWEREIDELVYDLYGLTKEEREIVEGRSKSEKVGSKSGKVKSAECPACNGRARSPSAPQSGSNDNALAGDCGGHGVTRPTAAKKPKPPVFEEEF